MILLSYTVAPWLIWLVTGSKNPAVLSNATWYLKTDTLFYFAPAAISILRNGLQGMGDHITPVFSSMIELIGKVICAFLLARIFQYWHYYGRTYRMDLNGHSTYYKSQKAAVTSDHNSLPAFSFFMYFSVMYCFI